MSDESRYGTSRPLFRIDTDRYVLNDGCKVKCRFPKVPIINRGATGNEFEHIKGYRGLFELTFYKIAKPSQNLLETIVDVDADSANPLYMRPHFNWYKEFNVRCLNGLEFEELLERIDAGYKVTLYFNSVPLETSSNIRSYGSFLNNGTTFINSPALTPITGDASVDFWVKWHSMAGGIIYVTDQNSPDLINWQIDSEPNGKLSFITGVGGPAHHLASNTVFTDGVWYHICCKRINTDDKYIYVNGVLDASASDTFVANDLVRLRVGHATAAFDYPIQIARLHSGDISGDLDEIMIEAIPSGVLSNIKVWWDFSEGNAPYSDLSGNSNDGTLTGTEAYYSESFPDNLHEMLT